MTDHMFTTTTEYGLSFREQLVLEITRGLASWDSGCLKEGYRGKVAEGIVDLANLIYEETQDYDEEPEEDA